MDSTIADPPASSGSETLDLEALDRGLTEAGLIAAEAIARAEALERQMAEVHAWMAVAGHLSGLPAAQPAQPPARERAAAAWNLPPGA